MYNHRIVIAQLKDRVNAILKAGGIDPLSYKLKDEFREKFKGEFLLLAIWLDIRNVVPDEFIVALDRYIKAKRLDPSKFSVSKDAVLLNDIRFTDALKLTEYIHANYPVIEYENVAANEKVEDYVPVITGDNIKIFEVNNAEDARNLVGKDTNWCIGASGSSNLWQSYRTNQMSTFFIVFDENPKEDREDPNNNLRKVAIDYAKTGISLTDITNRTGTKLSNGWYVDKYLSYLKSKNVDLDATRTNPKTGEEEKILQNKPISVSEEIESKIFSSPVDLSVIKEWMSGYCTVKFSRNNIVASEQRLLDEIKANYSDVQKLDMDSIAISDYYKIKNPEAPYYLSKYIGTGKILDDRILDFLMDSVGGENLLIKYVNTGIKLPRQQVEKIKDKKQLMRSYVAKQLQVGHHHHQHMDPIALRYLDPEKPEDYVTLSNVFKGWTGFLDYDYDFDDEVKNLDDRFLLTPHMIGNISPSYFIERFGKDELTDTQIKLYIAYGEVRIMHDYPTLENAYLFLGNSEAINELLEKAKSEGYGGTLLSEVKDKINKPNKFMSLPKSIKQLPEFADLENALYSISDIMYVPSETRQDPEYLKYKLFYDNWQDTDQIKKSHIALNMLKKKEFWIDFITNFDKISKNIEFATKNIDTSAHGTKIIRELKNIILEFMPGEFYLDEDILTALFENHLSSLKYFISSRILNPDRNPLLQKLIMKYADTFEKYITYFHQAVEGREDPYLKNLIRIDPDNYLRIKKYFRTFDEDLFVHLLIVHPEIQNSITSKYLPDYEDLPLDLQVWIKDNRPRLFYRLIEDDETRHLFATLLGEDDNTSYASHRKYVKIAQYFDITGKYNLADRITKYLS